MKSDWLLIWQACLRAGLIYALGDTVACLIRQQFNISRSALVLVVMGLVYGLELRWYFSWLARKFVGEQLSKKLMRAAMAWAWFNPLWIARHLILLHWFSGFGFDINAPYLQLGVAAFIAAAPVSIAANYIIQNSVPLHWRLYVSALFSALMAIYYAMSEVWFG